jgi:hypothetical protein
LSISSPHVGGHSKKLDRKLAGKIHTQLEGHGEGIHPTLPGNLQAAQHIHRFDKVCAEAGRDSYAVSGKVDPNKGKL